MPVQLRPESSGPVFVPAERFVVFETVGDFLRGWAHGALLPHLAAVIVSSGEWATLLLPPLPVLIDPNSGHSVPSIRVPRRTASPEAAGETRTDSLLFSSEGNLLGLVIASPSLQQAFAEFSAERPRIVNQWRDPPRGEFLRRPRGETNAGPAGAPKEGLAALYSTSPAADADIVERNPHIGLPKSFPPEPEPFEIVVYADNKGALPGEVAQAISINDPTGAKSYLIHCTLFSSDHFSCDQPNGSFTISRLKARSTEARFLVRRTHRPLNSGTPYFEVFLSHNNVPCGTARRFVSASPIEVKNELTVATQLAAPDLSFVMRGVPEAPTRSFHCQLFADGEVRSFNHNLPEEVSTCVLRESKSFVAAKDDPDLVRIRLLGAGLKLFNLLAHPYLQQAIHRLKGRTGPRPSILIASSEGAIPWELMVPDGDEEPLGVLFRIGRWVTQGASQPVQKSTPSFAQFVVPTYVVKSLRNAEAETDALLLLLKKLTPTVLKDAKVARLLVAFADPKSDLFHFICHGTSRENSALYLSDKVLFTATDLAGAAPKIRRAFKESRPVIFLNACEVGYEPSGLNGAEGFPREFMALGASAVIAPLWPVNDEVAREFSGAFYRTVLVDKTAGPAEAIRALRERAYASANTNATWGAYVFYGHPNLEFTRRPEHA